MVVAHCSVFRLVPHYFGRVSTPARPSLLQPIEEAQLLTEKEKVIFNV